MIPFNGYPRAYGSFSEPVAIPATEPDEGEQVCVQFGRNWLPYVLGSLQQLLLQATWIYTTEAELLAVQGSVFDLIATFGNAIDTGDCLTEPTFRQPDDCSLQVSIDGGETWSTIFDARACAIGAADNQIAEGLQAGTLGPAYQQPGPVTPPSGSTCYTYHVVLAANGKWFLPFPVNDGWTIETSNATGGANDGSIGPLWECPEGTIYTLGLCGANAGTHSGDPIDTINHMRLIMEVGTAYQDAYNTTYLVPAGTGSTDVAFQVNDTVLSDNNGSYEFDLSVCSAADPCTIPQTFPGYGTVTPNGTGFRISVLSANASDCAGTPNQEYQGTIIIPSGCLVRLHIDGNSGYSVCCSTHISAEYNTPTGVHNEFAANPFTFLNGNCMQDYLYLRSSTPFTMDFHFTADCP